MNIDIYGVCLPHPFRPPFRVGDFSTQGRPAAPSALSVFSFSISIIVIMIMIIIIICSSSSSSVVSY